MRTYLIIILNVQIQQLYFSKYHSQMSQWKQLARLHPESQSGYSRRSQKYTPRKMARDQQSPSRFHNQTIDKINNSAMSEQKQKSLGRSFVGRQMETQVEGKKMKTSSSQVRLHKDSIARPEMKQTYLSYGTQGLNKDRKSLDPPKPNQFGKPQKSTLYQQIQKIKKQFTIFQSIILKELQRQQKLINNMFEEIIAKMNEETENTRRNYELMMNTPHRAQTNEPSKTGKFVKKYSIQSDQKWNISASNISKVDKASMEEINQNQNKERTSPSFQRFFEAMENLKKDISDLNFMSDLSSVGSPKSVAKKQFNWEQVPNIR